MTSTLAVIDEFRSRARYVSPLDNSSGSLAGVYAILVGQHAPTDLAGELQWQQRGHNLRRLIRSYQVPQRSLEAEIAKLNSMRHAAEGWDGYQARKPNVRTIDLAIKFLIQFSKLDVALPTATVSPSGNAALFDSNQIYYLDIEFEPGDRAGWLLQLQGGPEIEDEEGFDGRFLPSRLVALLRSVSND
jgi:hypothetical protein